MALGEMQGLQLAQWEAERRWQGEAERVREAHRAELAAEAAAREALRARPARVLPGCYSLTAE